MIKNIVFDWSGVVNDNVRTAHTVANKVLTHFGAYEITLQEFKHEFKMPYMKFYNKYLPSLTLKEQQQVYDKYIKKVKNVNVYPGLPDRLKVYRKKGIHMFVNSSDLPQTLLREVQVFGLDGIFTEIFADVYDKLTALKEIVKKHNLKVSDSVFIGDTDYEVWCGKEIGMKTIAVTWGYQTRQMLKQANPDFIVGSLKEMDYAILKP